MGYVGKIKDSSGTTHLVASTLFGTCSTAIGTAAKVVTCSNFSQLENGVTIHVYFVNGNTAASPTLNVNSTGAIAVKRYGTTAPQCSTQNWAAGQIVSFTYYEVSSTDKRWVMNDIDQRFDLLTGTGEAAQDKGAGVSPRYFPAKWKFNLGKQPQDGDIITIRIPCAGHTNGVYISLDNGTNYKPVSINNTDRLTTNYANGKTITLVYESSGQTNDMFNINGGDIRENITGGCWTVLNYFNTNNSVTQTNTTGNASYRVLFSSTADNTTRTEGARKSTKLQFNPSTCTLQLYNESTTAANAPATILFSMKDTTTGKTYNGGYIKVYQDHGATPNGDNMVINSGGGMFLGSGESPSSHYSAKGSTYTGEDCFITADGSLHLQANGNTIANRKGLQITNGFALVPEQADVATDNVGSIGTSSYRWANGYFTNINGVTVGSTPSFTDEKVLQQNSTSGKYRPVLMGYDEINSPNDYSTTSVTNKTFKSQNLLFTPATGTLTTTNLSVTKINGVTVGDSPKFTDNDTTYTFADGTNSFTVTPAGGTAQTVTVTPSIANNITGSGTSGYLAKFNGTNTITSGPQLGSSTTTYLRNDGTWTTPPNTKNTAGSTDNTSDTMFLIGATEQSANPQTYSSQYIRIKSASLAIGDTGTQGAITLYDGATTDNRYGILKQTSGVSSAVTHYLPIAGGTLLNDTNTYYNSINTSGQQLGTLYINNDRSDIYFDDTAFLRQQAQYPSSITSKVSGNQLTSMDVWNSSNSKGFLRIYYGRPKTETAYRENTGIKDIPIEFILDHATSTNSPCYITLSLIGDIGVNMYIRKKSYRISLSSGNYCSLTPVDGSGRAVTINSNGTVTNAQVDNALIIYGLKTIFS